MYLAVIILKDEGKLEQLVMLMMECGFFDSSVVDGEGIENIASVAAPIYSEITRFFGHDQVYNRVIFTTVPDKDSLIEFIRLCREENIDFKDEEVATLIALKSDFDISEAD